jgi:hypothetical protein
VTEAPVIVAQNVQLQLVMDASEKPGKNSIFSVQVTDDTKGLWFSNNWSGVNTAVSERAPLIQEGKIMLH